MKVYSFYEASITLLSKSAKDCTQKTTSQSHINIDMKVLNISQQSIVHFQMI